jgi:hypothetical protein
VTVSAKSEVSSQPARASGPTPSGRPQRLVRTTPAAMVAVCPSPASTPTVSSSARGPSTTSPTPSTPSTPQTSRQAVGRSCSRTMPRAATKQGLGRTEGARHPAGQPFGRHEQQRHGAYVEGAEHRGLPPPRPARQHPGDRQRQQPRGQGPHQPGEQRMAGREQPCGHCVGGAPRGRGEHGQGDACCLPPALMRGERGMHGGSLASGQP